ncbi:MAG: DNA primase [Alphaproteobacteria bacterium]|nr:DNA primase [Alphaproteobacteria bacterium]NCQ87721.1 DNA primase [Alphaproteobacteria bacterium]NCT05770.1 DNA primase [Alphaproteobacteria bacterium]
MSIPARFLDELRTRLNISDIVGRKVRITRAGREFKGCCPFHHEKTPSFYVNDDKQFYHCFGCGAHGDIIGFSMQHDNLSFIEAVEVLAQEAGMQVPEQTPQAREQAKKEKGLHALMEDATRWMEAQLRAPENAQAYRYIVERGLPDELLSAFRVGYAPAERQALRNFLKSQDYTDKQMIEAGVLRPAGQNGEPYAFFRERIMFPVMDRRGRVIAFGGRILPDNLRPPDQGDYVPAKYMNSSDTPLFFKGAMLYGEPHARQAAIDGQDIIVVEGYMDAIACFKAGFRGAVAPMGTALTEEQIMVLWKMIPSEIKVPILCFDGDNAGRRAAQRAADRLLPHLKANHSARFAFLPDGQDPDTLVNSGGKKALEGILKAAMPLIDFLWLTHTQGKDFSTPEARAGLTKTLEDEVLRIADRDVQHYYRQAFRDRIRQAFNSYGVNANNVGASYAKKTNTKYLRTGVQSAPVTNLRRPSFQKAQSIKLPLLACVINHPHIFDYVEERLGVLDMGEVRLNAVRQCVLNVIIENNPIDRANLISNIEDAGFSDVLRSVLNSSVYTHAGFCAPTADEDDIISGWDRAWSALSQMEAEQEDKKRNIIT